VLHLTLLNCVPVNDTSVLYIDGDVECYQPWQYGIMAYTVVMVLPFCAVIFYGPGLLRDCLISLPHFFCACVLPLPFLIAWICLRLCLNGRKPPNAGQAPFEVKAVIQILQGPFKDAQTRLLGPTCGQGIVLGRRLILILLFTFVNDSLMRMLCMNLFCFVMLLHHVHVLPYKDRRGNSQVVPQPRPSSSWPASTWCEPLSRRLSTCLTGPTRCSYSSSTMSRTSLSSGCPLPFWLSS
jgi:hypothetical protein